jgi:hypothetical protein
MGVKSFIGKSFNHRSVVRSGPVIALGAIVLLTAFLFPGDAPWLNDEPAILERARVANQQPSEFAGISLPFTLAQVGLRGTRGVNYGPLPIWFYQALLGITHDPINLVQLRALMFSGLTGFALLWLARSMRLSLWFAAFSMLSPWMWVFSRDLWDNTFCIPLAGIAVSAYGDFLITRRRWALLLAAICLGAMTLVHLMCLALIAGIVIHFLIFERRWAVRFRWSLLAVGILWACVFFPYLRAMGVLYQPGAEAVGSPWNGWWHPLLGGQHLTAFRWLSVTGPHYPAIFSVCQVFTLLPDLAVWLGMVLILIRLCARAKLQSFTPGDHLALLSVLVAVCQSFADGIERIDFQPHYFNATWIAYVILAWYVVDALIRLSRKRAIMVYVPVTAYVTSAVIVLGISIIRIHIDGGTRSIDYGTALGEQIQAVRRIEEFSPGSLIDDKYPQWVDFPGAKHELMELIPPEEAAGSRPLRRLVVRYRDEVGENARIVVEDFALFGDGR